MNPQAIMNVLSVALTAPSGDNLQPFALRLRGHALDVRFRPDVAKSALDPGGLASRMACGALLENLELAGAAAGMRTHCVIHPDPAEPLLWARVTFAPAPPTPSRLADAIEKRATNRARFDRSPLSPEILAALAASNETDAIVELITEPRAIGVVASIAGDAERARSTIREAHEDLQKALRWTPEDAERTADGLDVRTLGLSWIERAMLRFVGPWWRARIFLGLGGSAAQGSYASRLARSASAFAWIGIRDRSPKAFMEAGRAMQRLWLEATVQGLQVSPFAAFPLLALAREREPAIFGESASRRLERASAREAALREGRAGRCVMLLRIGRAAPPKVRSLRRPFSIESSQGASR